MRGYHKLLRQYGLIPVGNEASEPAVLGAASSADSGTARQIVDAPDFATWDEVVERSDEFILKLYSPRRVEAIWNAHCRRGSGIHFGTWRNMTRAAERSPRVLRSRHIVDARHASDLARITLPILLSSIAYRPQVCLDVFRPE